jgi:hypothetical protein
MHIYIHIQVTLSSLNRHAVAGLKDVGLSKAEVLKTRLMELGLPRLQIDACRALFKMETASVLLGPWKETGGGEGEEGGTRIASRGKHDVRKNFSVGLSLHDPRQSCFQLSVNPHTTT